MADKKIHPPIRILAAAGFAAKSASPVAMDDSGAAPMKPCEELRTKAVECIKRDKSAPFEGLGDSYGMHPRRRT